MNVTNIPHITSTLHRYISINVRLCQRLSLSVLAFAFLSRRNSPKQRPLTRDEALIDRTENLYRVMFYEHDLSNHNDYDHNHDYDLLTDAFISSLNPFTFLSIFGFSGFRQNERASVFILVIYFWIWNGIGWDGLGYGGRLHMQRNTTQRNFGYDLL